MEDTDTRFRPYINTDVHRARCVWRAMLVNNLWVFIGPRIDTTSVGCPPPTTVLHLVWASRGAETPHTLWAHCWCCRGGGCAACGQAASREHLPPPNGAGLASPYSPRQRFFFWRRGLLRERPPPRRRPRWRAHLVVLACLLPFPPTRLFLRATGAVDTSHVTRIPSVQTPWRPPPLLPPPPSCPSSFPVLSSVPHSPPP